MASPDSNGGPPKTPQSSTGDFTQAGRPSPPPLYRRHSQRASTSDLFAEAAAAPNTEYEGQPSRHKVKYRKVVQGITIYKDHPSYHIMVNLKLGIWDSVGRVSALPNRELMLSDFAVSVKRFFPKQGSSDTPAHKSGDFKWKEYAPMAFRHFRERFKIDAVDFMNSICGETALRELPTPGKSGALFYLSQDDRFIIKTVSKRESKFLREILPSYYMHFMQNPNLLLTRFYGHFRVKTDRSRKIRFVIMNNILQTKHEIHERFDLKGSQYGRYTPEENRDKPGVTFKDNDYLEMQKSINLFGIAPLLVRQLQADARFLEGLGIMDYSLFIGLYYEDTNFQGTNPNQHPVPQRRDYEVLKESSGIFVKDDGGIRAVTQAGDSVIMYFGIIDILQEYNARKKVEHGLKVLILESGVDPGTVSVANPTFYADRFLEYMDKYFC